MVNSNLRYIYPIGRIARVILIYTMYFGNCQPNDNTQINHYSISVRFSHYHTEVLDNLFIKLSPTFKSLENNDNTI